MLYLIPVFTMLYLTQVFAMLYLTPVLSMLYLTPVFAMLYLTLVFAMLIFDAGIYHAIFDTGIYAIFNTDICHAIFDTDICNAVLDLWHLTPALSIYTRYSVFIPALSIYTYTWLVTLDILFMTSTLGIYTGIRYIDPVLDMSPAPDTWYMICFHVVQIPGLDILTIDQTLLPMIPVFIWHIHDYHFYGDLAWLLYYYQIFGTPELLYSCILEPLK